MNEVTCNPDYFPILWLGLCFGIIIGMVIAFNIAADYHARKDAKKQPSVFERPYGADYRNSDGSPRDTR
jgi:hypothetical protein